MLTPEETSVDISFEDTAYPPVRVHRGEELSEVLDAGNSPLLFGCRNGICGTCVVEVDVSSGTNTDEIAVVERESLELYAPENPKARLACQMRATANMRIKTL